MKLKLDENLGRRAEQRLRAAGLDVSTVVAQRLSGAPDEQIYRACVAEHRILITCDLDFSQVLRFPPGDTAGIAVLSPLGRMTSGLLDILLEQLVAALRVHAVESRLWIVEPGRIRVHAADEE